MEAHTGAGSKLNAGRARVEEADAIKASFDWTKVFDADESSRDEANAEVGNISRLNFKEELQIKDEDHFWVRDCFDEGQTL